MPLTNEQIYKCFLLGFKTETLHTLNKYQLTAIDSLKLDDLHAIYQAVIDTEVALKEAEHRKLNAKLALEAQRNLVKDAMNRLQIAREERAKLDAD